LGRQLPTSARLLLITSLHTIQPIKQKTKLPNPVTYFIRLRATTARSLDNIANSVSQREPGIDGRRAQPWRRVDELRADTG
jgi:hypothetical protein